MSSMVAATLGARSLIDYQGHICTHQKNAEAVGHAMTRTQQQQRWLTGLLL